MNKLIFILLALYSTVNCQAESNYRLEAIEGQMIRFDIIYKDSWPITTESIVLNGDSIEIISTDYDDIINSIYKAAKYTPVLFEGDILTALKIMFSHGLGPVQSSEISYRVVEKLYRMVDDTFDEETSKLKTMNDDLKIVMHFYNIQAIAMVTTKDIISGFYSEGIEYEKIPEEVYVPLFIINAEKTDDLKVKFDYDKTN